MRKKSRKPRQEGVEINTAESQEAYSQEAYRIRMQGYEQGKEAGFEQGWNEGSKKTADFCADYTANLFRRIFGLTVTTQNEMVASMSKISRG